jgi:hypothetical protein
MGEAEGVTDERLLAAHRAMRDRGDVQFDLLPLQPPAPPPEWLKKLARSTEQMMAPVGRFLRWISSFMPEAPYARIFLWTVIAILLVLVLRVAFDRVRHGEWRLPRLRRSRSAADAGAADSAEEDWTPAAEPARQWLNEADRLAAAGQYAEAVHHLLLRSVEDISQRRPRLLRPALTSRDLARADAIPSAPRRLFADLAAVVERSLFGGAPVGAEEWGRCREAYADFARARSWQA